MEFLVHISFSVPDGTDQQQIAELRSAESVRAAELSAEGYLLRLWRPPPEEGHWGNVGLWCAADTADLTRVMSTLPLYNWMTISVTPLGLHPSDPGA